MSGWGWNDRISEKLHENCNFTSSDCPAIHRKKRCRLGKNLVHRLRQGILYTVSLYKIPTYTVGFWRIFETPCLQKQLQIMKKLTECWDKKSENRSGTALSQTVARVFLIVCGRSHFCQEKNKLFDRLTSLWSHFLKIQCIRFYPVDKNTRFHIRKLLTSSAAFSIYQKFLHCALHNEMLSGVGMDNSIKSTYIYLLWEWHDLDLWRNHDHWFFFIFLQ